PGSDAARDTFMRVLRQEPKLAFQAFEGLEAGGFDTVPGLVEMVASSDAILRGWAVQKLEDVGPQALAAASVLRKSLADPEVRLAAAVALPEIEGGNEGLLPTLLVSMKPPRGSDLFACLKLIRALGAEAIPAVPLLIDCLKWESDLTLFTIE